MSNYLHNEGYFLYLDLIVFNVSITFASLIFDVSNFTLLKLIWLNALFETVFNVDGKVISFKLSNLLKVNSGISLAPSEIIIELIFGLW
ncbi:Uncharacterised protein, partial [Mycoplasmopsis edwardii]